MRLKYKWWHYLVALLAFGYMFSIAGYAIWSAVT